VNVIGGRTDSLLRRVDDPAVERNLRIISEQIARISRIVREMLQFAQVKEITPAPVDLVELIQSVLEFLEERIEEKKIRVRIEPAPVLPAVWVDRDQIYEVFLNLALNAVDSMPSGGTLRIATCAIHGTHPERGGSPEPYLRVSLHDTGIGIQAEDLERIFDPFFTTKGVGRGTGLGLSVSYGIIREHGGWMEVTSEPGHGTELVVHLPTAARGSAVARRAEAGT
jgi:signal transduction histidine kinase